MIIIMVITFQVNIGMVILIGNNKMLKHIFTFIKEKMINGKVFGNSTIEIKMVQMIMLMGLIFQLLMLTLNRH